MSTRMAAEMAEQPEAVARTLAQLRPLRADLARLAAEHRQVLFVARGSSDNAAMGLDSAAPRGLSKVTQTDGT